MTDKEFRLKLLNEPATAIKELTGKEIPAGLKLQIVEQAPSADMAFVLPPILTDTLSDEQLDQVAAGKAPLPCPPALPCALNTYTL